MSKREGVDKTAHKPGVRTLSFGTCEGPCRPVLVSTYPPEQCGLATFTCDLADAVDGAAGRAVSGVFAIQKTESLSLYDQRVVHTINNNDEDAYFEAAEATEACDCNVVCIQHEYGLYAREWGEAILDFADSVDKPLVTTLHTLCASPEPKAREIVKRLVERSSCVVVMANLATGLLEESYGVSTDHVVVIPHGVPQVRFSHRALLKRRLGLQGKTVITTFGLINRGKGLEHAIAALPTILREHPDTIYLIAGRTHPAVKAHEGESYRDELKKLAARLGVKSSLVFVDRYMKLEELLSCIQASDVYLTPYTGRDQVTSGTLAYAMACGKAVVSTPYLYAEEALGEGRGLLAEFNDPNSIADNILKVLEHPMLKEELEFRTYRYAQDMIWPVVGKRYLTVFKVVADGRSAKSVFDQPRTSLGILGKETA